MSAAAAPFADGREQLAAELAWLDRALHLLVNTTAPAGWEPGGDGEAADSPESVRKARRDLVARVEAGGGHGSPPPLLWLGALFRLTPEEELLLLACAAAELDARFGEVYGRLHGDATRRRPSLRLVSAVAGLDPRCPADGGALLDPRAAVFRWRLATAADGGAPHRPDQGIALDPGVLALIAGRPWAEDRIGGALRPLPAADPVADPAADPAADLAAWPYGDAVDRLTTLLADDAGHVVAHFHGPLAAEGRRIAPAACRRLGVGLLHADAEELLALSRSGELPLEEGLRLVYRQAALTSAGVYLSGVDALLDDARAAAHLRALGRLLADAPWFTCTEGERLWPPGPSLPEHVTFLPFEPPALDHRQRRTVWRRALPGLPDEQVIALATTFSAAPGEVADAVRLARGRARAAGGAEPSYEDLLWACRTPGRAALDGLATPRIPRAGWDDLVLPAGVLDQLRELCAQVRHRGLVLDEWALGRRTALGHGVQALFLGPSGTGKTLAAEVVAAAVGMDLVKVDLSAVVSKYIGETEKHLARVFAATERSGSILLFDEADALFGKRSEVGDAHDRYANLEVSYLLQRIEEYAGVVILATNFAQNIDQAFQRRLRLSITFPFPDEAARLALWRRHLPAELPVDADLDLAGMARRFKVPGGVIRKIVWNAAFLAADDGGRLGAGHLLLATRREYGRMGKPFPMAEAAGVAR